MRDVGAELDESGDEVVVVEVDVSLVDEREGKHQPRVGAAAGGVVGASRCTGREPSLGPCRCTTHSCRRACTRGALGCDLVLRLPLAELHHVDAHATPNKPLEEGDEACQVGAGARGHVEAVSAQEPGHARGSLQRRGEDIEIQVVEISNMRVAASLDLQTNRIRRIAKERRLSR